MTFLKNLPEFWEVTVVFITVLAEFVRENLVVGLLLVAYNVVTTVVAEEDLVGAVVTAFVVTIVDDFSVIILLDVDRFVNSSIVRIVVVESVVFSN